MTRFLILSSLFFITGCSIFSLNDRSKSTGSDRLLKVESKNDTAGFEKLESESQGRSFPGIFSEEGLTASIDRYIGMINANELKGKTNKRNPGSPLQPVIAVTEQELARLKAAWATPGEARDFLERRFRRADEALKEELSFPPEGGQHNQWYQCDSCQIGLRTIDAHHHKCPSCGRVYSGFPYDNVLYNRHHGRNLRNAEDAAWAWAVTGSRQYAGFAAAVLTGYAERYLVYPMVSASVNDNTIDIASGKQGKYRSAGHMQSQTLDEANSMIPAVISYDLIRDYLSEPQRQKIEEGFIRPMAECINVYKAGRSNWQTWHNAALLYAGAVLGDGEMIRQAFLDDKNGFTFQMKTSVLQEGMWYENSWGYHYYTLSAMTHIAEGARRLGIDIYSHPMLRKMYLIPFDYLMSDGSLPRFGDAVQDSPLKNGINEKAWAAYKDDRLLAALSSELSWDAIVFGRDLNKLSPPVLPASKLLPGAGHAILATNGPGKLTAALTFGPYGGFHGHFDKLSFVFFGYGEELGVDPGRAASQAYRLPVHRDWYKSGTGHNIVLVDGLSQKESEGKCLAFISNDSCTAIAADAGPAFTGVSHIRFMLLVNRYLLVIDELKNNDGEEHIYDWLYHNKGKDIECFLPKSEMILEKKPAGYGYLNNITAHICSDIQTFHSNFAGEKVSVHLVVAGEKGDDIFTATGPFTSTEDRVPVIIVRRKGRTVRFVSVLEPLFTGEMQKVKTISMRSDAEFSVAINSSQANDIVVFPQGNMEKFIVRREKMSGSEILLQN